MTRTALPALLLAASAGCASGPSMIGTVTPVSPTSYDAIAGRAKQLGCEVGDPDEVLGMIVDCPEGRIVFGPNIPVLQSDPKTLEAHCFRGLESRCQEYAERLLGMPVTPEESRYPKAPNPLAKPPGQGWSCFTQNFGGTLLPLCLREESECKSRHDSFAQAGREVTPCVRVERAACFTEGKGGGYAVCAATMKECQDQPRPSDASPCAEWE